ncbi:hypothetical protein U1Q18_008492 [Sarracenia purpurea var. burkii]
MILGLKEVNLGPDQCQGYGFGVLPPTSTSCVRERETLGLLWRRKEMGKEAATVLTAPMKATTLGVDEDHVTRR